MALRSASLLKQGNKAVRAVMQQSALSQSVRDSAKLFGRAVGGHYEGGLVVWLIANGTNVHDDGVVVEKTSVQQVCCGQGIDRRWRYSCKMRPVGFAVLVLPKGWAYVAGTVVYGGRDVDTMLCSRYGFSGEIFPCGGEVKQGDPSVDVTLLLGHESFGLLAEAILDPRSSEARFVSLVKADAVLKLPRHVNYVGGFDFKVVEVTDPLDNWTKTRDVRLEQFQQECGVYNVLRGNEYRATCIDRFRTPGCAYLDVNGCVQFQGSEASVVFCGGLLACRVVSSLLNANGAVGATATEKVDWSCHEQYIADEYVMDDGGPSGSDGEFFDEF